MFKQKNTVSAVNRRGIRNRMGKNILLKTKSFSGGFFSEPLPVAGV
jgi:hypothetical protein